MGLQRPAGPPPESPAAAGAQTVGDEPFPVRVSAHDRRAFAERVFDQHAEEIYRYVLAWTNDRAVAHDLTAQVLRTAVAQMKRLGGRGTDLEARMVALARAAVARRLEAESESGEAPAPDTAARNAAAFAASEPVPLLLAEVARLDDARREALILRQLLGHSVEHAACLLAFDEPVVEELERSACATLWRRVNHAQETRAVSAWDALTVAAALRQGAPTWFAPPGEAALAALRELLLDGVAPDRGGPAASVPAQRAAGDRRRLLPTVVAFAARRRWLLAGCVVAAAVGTAAAVTMADLAGQSLSCGRAASCLVTTTAGGVADTVQTFPSTAPGQSGGLPTSTTRLGAGPAFPVLSSTVTTGMAPTTATMPGTTTAPPTTGPRRTTTTTGPATTSTTSPPTSTTGPTTSTGP